MKTITNSTLKKLSRFFATCDNYVYLDTSKPDKQNTRSLLFCKPLQRLQFFEGDDETIFLDKVQQLQRDGRYIAGWFSYEFGYLFEPNLKKLLQRQGDRGVLHADLGVFDRCYGFDHENGTCDFPLAEFEEDGGGDYSVENLRLSQDREEYLIALQKILEYIRSGDTYQVNYTLKLFFELTGSPEKFYADLRRNQSVSYGAFIRWRDKRVMSFSPELFFWKKDNHVIVRPMKGTLKRGKTLQEDQENKDFLSSDIKNQSENVMIVDLLRNDLGRLMHHVKDGDVQVDSLFDVETYETLLQMTSTISGRTSDKAIDSVPLHTFFKTIFPCGSVTGAPKIRTMEIIDELEKDRRGVYTGAIGYIAPDGEAVFNVPIRTVVLDGSKGEMGIGSGIVHDSVPEKEWQECLLKGKFLTEPQKSFYLFETILWQPQDGYFLLDQHLHRLQGSAKYYLFMCDIKNIVATLKTLEQSFSEKPMRVRLRLCKDGEVSVESWECEHPKLLTLPNDPEKMDPAIMSVKFSRESVNTDNVWHYHKTSNRELYNTEFEKAQSAGLFDVLFVNQNGLVTEGCISNIIVYIQGKYFTPPISDGLLGGVMRQFLLDEYPGMIQEKSLQITDIKEAQAIFLCNSVRGLVQVRLEDGGVF